MTGIPPREGEHRRRPSFAAASILTYGTNLTVAVLGLGNVLVMSRTLGPDGRGQVVFLMAVTMITGSLSRWGVQLANANIASREPGARRALSTNSFLLALVFGGAGGLIVLGLTEAFPGIAGGSDPTLRHAAIASVPVLVLLVYWQLLVQADYAFRVSNLSWLLAAVTNVSVNGIMAATGSISVTSAFVTWIASMCLATGILGWHIVRRLAGFGRPDPRLAWASIRFGAKAHAGQVMLLGNYRLDAWILGAIAGATELGLYSVAVAWAEALWFLPTALATVQRPDLVRATAAGAGQAAATVLRLAVWLTIPLAVAVVLAAPFLCVTVFGDEFAGSVDDLRMLVPGAFGVVALKLLGNALTAQGKPMLETAAIGVAFAFTVGLDFVLIPHLGGLGAALASTLAYTAGGITVLVVFARALGAGRNDLVPRFGDLVRLARMARSQAARLVPRVGE